MVGINPESAGPAGEEPAYKLRKLGRYCLNACVSLVKGFWSGLETVGGQYIEAQAAIAETQREPLRPQSKLSQAEIDRQVEAFARELGELR